MDKKLTISSVLDNSAFDRTIAELQRKIDNFRNQTAAKDTSTRLQQGGLGGIMSGPSQEAFQRSTAAFNRDLEKSIKEQANIQERLGKEMAKSAQTLKKLQDLQKTLVKDTVLELETKEKIARVEATVQKQREQYRRNDEILNQSMDIRDAQRAARQKDIRDAQRAARQEEDIRDAQRAARQEDIRARNAGGFGLAGRYAKQGMFGAAGRSLWGAIGGFGGIGGALSNIGALSGVVGDVLGATAGIPMRIEGAKGTAIQGTVGQDLSRIYGGKSVFEAAFLPERAKAAGIAQEKSEKERTADIFKAIGTATSGALSGALKGAALGGAAGLAIGGIGAIPGAIGGGLIGAFGGGAKALAGNDRERERLLGLMPGSLGAQHRERYDQILAAQRAKDFREVLEDLKNQDPAKKMAIENFEQNYLKNLEVQRTLGISNRAFYGAGGLLQRSAAAGFTADQAMGMAQSIVGAGGSARMGRQAEFGLQMQRMGLTNASQLLGTLSGGIQAPEANKRAIVSIISEAFQIGLDNTDFAEEQRRFSQAAANVIARTGATGEDAQGRIAANLGMFVGDRTNIGIQAAQSAYERSQERGSALGGRRGALRMMDVLQDKDLSKIPTNELTELLNLRPEQLNEEDEMVKYFASRAEITPAQLLEKMGKGREKTRFLIPGNRKKVTELQNRIADYMKEQKLSRTEFQRRREEGTLPAGIQQALGGIEAITMTEEKSGLTTPERRAMAMEFLPGAEGPTTAQKAATMGMLKGVGGRLEDKAQAAAAEGADSLRKQFVLLVPELEKAVSASKKLADGVSEVGETLHRKAEVLRSGLPTGDPMARFGAQSVLQGAKIQPQSGKSNK